MNKISILIAEDKPLFQGLFLEFLGGHQFVERIELAKTAEAALGWASRERFDVFLLEFSLPDKKALEIIPQLREQTEESMIIILTNNYAEAYQQAGVDGGADVVLHKNRLYNDLIPLIRSYMVDLSGI